MTVSKSDQIRDLLSRRPNLSPSEIQAELARQGVEVSRTLCKVVRHRQRAAKSEEGEKDRPLRQDETRMGGRVFRLSEEDRAVWRYLERFAKRLADPSLELHVFDGRLIRRQRRVHQWLNAVSTRSAKRRRKDILDHFIEDLRRAYPKPEKTKGRPPIRKRSSNKPGTRRRLTEEERKCRIKGEGSGGEPVG